MSRVRLSVGVVCLALACGSLVQAATNSPYKKGASPRPEAKCELLDDVKARGKMDGLLKWLLIECGRANELGQVRQEPAIESLPESGPGATDVQVNDSSGDGTGSTTQSETSIIFSPTTGTLCSGYNDSNDSSSFSGFSRSTDSGATWDDRGSLPNGSSGDPSIVWRRVDGKFYYVSLRSGGLGIWRSDDDCLTFTFVAQIVTGSDDKELMAIDNNPASPYYGRIYVAWTDFGQGDQIYNVYSDDAGATWSAQIALSAGGVDVQGAWPAVAPNGDYYVAWLRWDPWPSGPVTIEIVKSTDGGDSFAFLPSPMSGEVNPRDSVASNAANCNRPALNGNIRYLPSPQIMIGTDGALHVVYAYDPDGFDVGDVTDVFYRKYSSLNGVLGWGPEVKLNDDATTNDQYYPNLSVGAENIVVVSFYDRRLSAGNLEQDTFKTVSPDGGTTWLANERVSDVSTPIYLDPGLANCYHGDYDQITQVEGQAFLQWSDDRNMANGHNDPDVWFEATAVSNDFVVTADPSSMSVCAPATAGFDIDVLQFQGFSEPVTLGAAGNPAGTSVDFSDNPVTPPGSSSLSINVTGAAPPGTFPITVTGTSDPSAIEHDTTLGLSISTVTPLTPDLVSPANGATDVNTMLMFEWDAVDQAAGYDFELATDADFNNVVDSATMTESSYTTAVLLDTNTDYFWRVSASNICGSSGESATFAFRTVVAPGDCSDPSSAWQHYYQDFENGAPGWTSSSGIGPNTWMLVNDESMSGTTSYHAEDVDEISDQYLVSPAIELPDDGLPISLGYWNLQDIEASSSGCFDAGVLEISTDGGANWIRLETELLTDPYDGLIDDEYQNPLLNENGWCGDPEPWVKSIVDLNVWAGESVQFRFRLATDVSIGQPGWWIDDVEVRSCGAMFADGFNTGNTGRWTETVAGN